MAFSLASSETINTWSPQRDHGGLLFHYTKIDTLPFFVAGSLRLSRFTLCNDPSEFASIKSWRFKNRDREKDEELKNHLEFARQNGHVVCFSNSPIGYAIAPMWAHYGTGLNRAIDAFQPHRGCCVVFDHSKLTGQFASVFGDDVVHGPITYLPSNAENSIVIDASFSGDPTSAAQEFVENNLWFRKHDCWSYESEYRIAVKNQPGDYATLTFSDAIVGIFVGCDTELADMRIALEAGGKLGLTPQDMNVVQSDRGEPRHFLLGAHHLAVHSMQTGTVVRVPKKAE